MDRETKRAADRAYAATHREEAKARAKAWYWANRERARQSRKLWRDANLDKVIARRATYRTENLEAIRERDRRRSQTPERKEQNREQGRRRAEVVRTRVREWAKANPERARILRRRSNDRRRARLAGVEYENIDRDRIIARDQGVCGICWEIITDPAEMSLDHVIPIARGGSHTYGNVQLAHLACNKRKGHALFVGGI